MAGVVGPTIPGVTDGLVFYVDAALSYTSGNTIWYDLVGTGNGTLINNPTFDSGNGGSLTFDGSDDSIDLDTHASTFSGLNIGSVSIWFKIESSESGGCLFSIAESSDPKIISINNSRRNTNKPVIIDDDDGGSGGWNLNAYESTGNGSKYRDGVWHNVFLVVGSSSNKLYMDGSELSLTYGRGSSSTGNWLFPLNLDSMRIGVSRHGGTERLETFFEGQIATTQLYNRVLSPTEITQNYNALKSRFNL